MLTLETAANLLGVSKVTLRRMTDRGELPCYRIGARLERRFQLRDVESYLASRRDLGKAEKKREDRLD